VGDVMVVKCDRSLVRVQVTFIHRLKFVFVASLPSMKDKEQGLVGSKSR